MPLPLSRPDPRLPLQYNRVRGESLTEPYQIQQDRARIEPDRDIASAGDTAKLGPQVRNSAAGHIAMWEDRPMSTQIDGVTGKAVAVTGRRYRHRRGHRTDAGPA